MSENFEIDGGPAPDSPSGRATWVPGRVPGLTWETVVPATPAAEVFAAVLGRRMARELRDEAEQVRVEYEPRTDGSARIIAVADAAGGRSGALLGGFVDVLAGLRAGRIDPDELPADASAGDLDEPPADASVGVTRDDVAAVALDADAAGLLTAPVGTNPEWAGFVAAPVPADAAGPRGGPAWPRGSLAAQWIATARYAAMPLVFFVFLAVVTVAGATGITSSSDPAGTVTLVAIFGAAAALCGWWLWRRARHLVF
ncbi:hypothetical protein HH310_38425 [Actinoplanes sp. TBRC 11911]|uniref:hypothetical protein n=1 Tax=Actinoplanes sp. TBRC 11911 TaxID=2729386 RepID=UPI00145F50F2|nr:hypothetical protein [Actinoplanes sp. TBRC 11911]NMO57041.1 hypothetical protein [Actinoplanes sp. TBRC 11911]